MLRARATDGNASVSRTLTLSGVGDWRALARYRLPRQLFKCVEGGSGGEVTLGRDREGFRALALRQRFYVASATLRWPDSTRGAMIDARELAPVRLAASFVGPDRSRRRVRHRSLVLGAPRHSSAVFDRRRGSDNVKAGQVPAVRDAGPRPCRRTHRARKCGWRSSVDAHRRPANRWASSS